MRKNMLNWINCLLGAVSLGLVGCHAYKNASTGNPRNSEVPIEEVEPVPAPAPIPASEPDPEPTPVKYGVPAEYYR